MEKSGQQKAVSLAECMEESKRGYVFDCEDSPSNTIYKRSRADTEEYTLEYI